MTCCSLRLLLADFEILTAWGSSIGFQKWFGFNPDEALECIKRCIGMAVTG